MSESDIEMEVGEILGERKSKKGLEYLVRWKNFGKGDDSWEPLRNLVNAVGAIADFHKKAVTTQKKKRDRKSSSRSRSRSRSRGRSGSKSPGRGKKKASPARSTSRSRKSVTKTTVTSTPTMNEKKVETVTRSPGRFEQTTETITRKSYPSPAETSRLSTVSRVTEVRTSTDRVDGPVSNQGGFVQTYVTDPLKSLREGCGCVARSDYPAIVVFATIAIIVLSFVIQKNVNFENVWTNLVEMLSGIRAWFTARVSGSK